MCNVAAVSYSDFVNKELIHFSMMDNMRSIPSLVDGLKPGQRKILFACFKRKLKAEIKVAQLAGYDYITSLVLHHLVALHHLDALHHSRSRSRSSLGMWPSARRATTTHTHMHTHMHMHMHMHMHACMHACAYHLGSFRMPVKYFSTRPPLPALYAPM